MAKTSKQAKQKSIFFWTTLILIAVLVGLLVLNQYLSSKHEGKEQEEETDEAIAAMVNGEPIYNSEVDSQYEILPEQMRLYLTKDQLLDRMINNLILYQEGKKAGISADEAYPSILREMGRPYTPEEFAVQIENQGVPFDAFEEDLKTTIVIADYLMQEVPVLEPNASLIDASFLEYQGFVGATQYAASHILVNTSEEAAAIKAQIDAGADFAQLAREHSLDSGSAAYGGDLGWFPEGQMVPEFETALASLTPGQVSDPVETMFGFHIIKLQDKRSGETVTKEMVLPYLRFRLFSTLVQQHSTEFMDFINAKRATAAVEITYGAKDKDVVEISSLEDLQKILDERIAAANNTANEAALEEDTSAPEASACPYQDTVFFTYIPGSASQAMEQDVDVLIAEGFSITKVNYLESADFESCTITKGESFPQLVCERTGNAIFGKQEKEAIKSFVENCLS